MDASHAAIAGTLLVLSILVTLPSAACDCNLMVGAPPRCCAPPCCRCLGREPANGLPWPQSRQFTESAFPSQRSTCRSPVPLHLKGKEMLRICGLLVMGWANDRFQ
jgi:hypothetical protein